MTKASVSQSFTRMWEKLRLIPKQNQLTDLGAVPSSCHRKRHGCPCKLPQCFSSVNVIYSWSSLTWWLIYTQEKFRNGLADQCFVWLWCYLSQVLQLQEKSVGEINYIEFSEIFPEWTHWTQNVQIKPLIGKFSPPLKQGGTSEHTTGIQKGAFESAPKTVLHSSILVLVMMLQFF